MPTTQAKRILKIEVKRMDDSDPDTSWLGEYSNTRANEFSIDRKHALDCQSVQPSNDAVVDQLERAIQYLDVERIARTETYDSHSGTVADNIGEAQDILVDAQDRVTECDCDESGDMSSGEYRYFNPSFNYVDARGNALPEYAPEDVRKYVQHDYERMESLNRCGWGFIGIQAEAQVVIGSVIQTITSGGLWGIESDSDASYMARIATEQFSELRDTLHQMGFSKRAISSAVKAATL